MKIPFVDLDAQYQSIKSEVLQGVEEVIESKSFINGPYAKEFEQNFSEVHGVAHSVGCANGTSAITLALRSLGIGPGDEVITVVNTFFATVEAIYEVGAEVKFVDIDPDSYLMDLEQLEKIISKRTKAIIPVHLYGNPVNMNRLMDIAKVNDLKVVEDSAQAHLASLDGKSVGTFGEFGTFSFYPGKNLGAYGDAGLVVSSDEKLASLARMYADHGRKSKYEHEILAGNYRIDGIQAKVLNIKLKYLEKWTDSRRAHASAYDEVLGKHGFKTILETIGGKCVYHLYVVEVSNRDEVMKHLKENGVSCGIHYPIPMHLQPAMTKLNLERGSFPVAEKVSDRIVSIPIFPELSTEQRDYILNTFLEVAKK